jgi:hypothetical protein
MFVMCAAAVILTALMSEAETKMMIMMTAMTLMLIVAIMIFPPFFCFHDATVIASIHILAIIMNCEHSVQS